MGRLPVRFEKDTSKNGVPQISDVQASTNKRPQAEQKDVFFSKVFIAPYLVTYDLKAHIFNALLGIREANNEATGSRSSARQQFMTVVGVSFVVVFTAVAAVVEVGASNKI